MSRDSAQAAEEGEGVLARPGKRLGLAFERIAAGGFGLGCVGAHQQDGGGVLDGSLETVPVRNWDLVQNFCVDFAEIEEHNSEASRVKQ